MRRALMVATLLAVPAFLSGQSTTVLRVTVMLPDETQTPIPISRHALLISDNPSTTVPKRVLTGSDGAIELQLIPGSYTVESDRPLTFGGKAYEWTQMIDVVAGRTVTLALTAANANLVAAPEPIASAGRETPGTNPPETEAPRPDRSLLSSKWLGSVVGVWSPVSRTTGFVFDKRGLIATRSLAAAVGTMVAVQVSATQKISARVVFADPVRDVAIVWVHPSAVASRTPLPLTCPASPALALADDQEIVALTAPFGRPPDSASGDVTGFAARVVETNMRVGFGGAGGPVFNAAGAVVGLTSLTGGSDRRQAHDVTVVRAGILCEVVATLQPSLSAATAPEPIALPTDPSRRYKAPAGEKTTGGSTVPVVSSSDFEIAFITPPLVHQAQQRADRTGGRSSRSPEAEARLGRVTEFGAWSDYFTDVPEVVIIRVSPKLVEGFWKRVAREAARTQGADLPPFKDFKTSFVRMRASCGSTEVVPVQPFVLEHKVSDTKTIREGLYVFDPSAFGPSCSRVTLSIYSEQAPDKADTMTIDGSLVRGPA